MRILICAPWFATIARKHAEILSGLGHEVRVVTTNAQGQRQIEPHFDEEVLSPRLRSASAWFNWARIVVRAIGWSPDLTLLDESWDVRFMLLARTGRKRAVLVHDPSPHDDGHRRRGWKRFVESASRRSGQVIGCFSDYALEHIDLNLRSRSRRLVLVSEQPWSVGPAMKAPGQIFVFVGRLSAYKGLSFLLEAWSVFHSKNPTFELVVLGSGSEMPELIPVSVRVIQGRYSDQDAIDLISKARGVVLPYREASQSGVQVMSLQLGAPTIATNVGALPEFQPPSFPIVEFGNVEMLVDALSQVASAEWQQSRNLARSHYDALFGERSARLAMSDFIGGLS